MDSRINGRTKLYALIGSPVGHSGSPAMYNYSFGRLGIDAAYLAFDVPLEKTEEAVAALRTLRAGGFNVTMPCKTRAAELADRLSPAAELVGACNTVVFEADGSATGHITDGIGFVRNLKEHGVEAEGSRAVILGAGGAASAIAVQLALDGAEEIVIFNRRSATFEKGERLTERIRKAVPSVKRVEMGDLGDEELLRRTVAAGDLLINATSLGMSPREDQIPVPAAFLHPGLAVADAVYNPRETLLLRKAKEAGCRAAVGGIGMLLWQGAAAFELYTGKEMPVQEVKERFFS